jgi:hypothetical protein
LSRGPWPEVRSPFLSTGGGSPASPLSEDAISEGFRVGLFPPPLPARGRRAQRRMVRQRYFGKCAGVSVPLP